MVEKKPFKKLFNKVVNLIMEEEIEIIDNGLDDVEENAVSPIESSDTNLNQDKKENVKEVPVQEVVEEKEKSLDIEEPRVKNKKPFMKSKAKTLEEDLFKTEEIKTTMELIKENPVPMVEVIETKDIEGKLSNKSGFKYEKAPSTLDNETDELTKEQKEAEEFYAKLDAGELSISKIRKTILFKNIEDEVFGNGFENTFFELMDAIEDNQVLERAEKISKKNLMLAELMKIDEKDDADIYDCFMVIRHELHKAKNGLGEYSIKVSESRELQQECILGYKISQMYENDNYRTLLLKSDSDSFTELLNLFKEIYVGLEENNYITKEKRIKMQNEYRDLLWLSDDISTILKNIELFKYDLYKLENGIDEFSKTSLALY